MEAVDEEGLNSEGARIRTVIKERRSVEFVMRRFRMQSNEDIMPAFFEHCCPLHQILMILIIYSFVIFLAFGCNYPMVILITDDL